MARASLISPFQAITKWWKVVLLGLRSGESEGKLEPVGRIFVLALVIAFFAITISGPIVSLLSLDIAKTFFPTSFSAGSSQQMQAAAIGAVTQIVTANSLFEVIFALVLGVVAVRFRHKPLLLVGVLLVIVSAVGAYFAPTLWVLGVFFAIEGAGTIMVGAMGMTLVGEFMPQKRKAKTISYAIAATAAATIVSYPIINVITNFGGWRLNFLLLAMPVSIFGLLLAYYGFPSTQSAKTTNIAGNVYLTSFKRVLLNRSAAFCLIGGTLGASGVVGTFALAFYRQQLALPLGYTSIIAMVAGLMYLTASLVIGRFVNRVGARMLVLVTTTANGIFTMTFFFMPTWWIAASLDMIHVWFYAATFTAFSCLALDQVPEHRSTMMSVRAVFVTLGGVVGAASGGAMLMLFGSYQAVGIVFGVMSVAAAGAFLLTKDTTKRP